VDTDPAITIARLEERIESLKEQMRLAFEARDIALRLGVDTARLRIQNQLQAVALVISVIAILAMVWRHG
jgi:hypothetical protein